MSRNRPTRPCEECGKGTKSVTRRCHKCRQHDDPPAVTWRGEQITFGGITLTPNQARRLVDRIHDTLEDGRQTL